MRTRGLATALLVAFLAGCGSSASPAPPPAKPRPPLPPAGPGGPRDATAVGFRAADGTGLRGRLFGHGRVAVVLAHMGNATNDESDWYPLARRLAREGYLVLAYNRRGVCTHASPKYDCSAGADDYATAWKDVVGAAQLVRARGAQRVALAGASIGGTSSIYAAKTGRIRVDALISLAGANYISTYSLTPADLRRIRAPKLFVTGRGDDEVIVRSARQWFTWSAAPKRLVLLPSDRHGTDMLAASEPTHRPLTRLITGFLEDAVPAR